MTVRRYKFDGSTVVCSQRYGSDWTMACSGWPLGVEVVASKPTHRWCGVIGGVPVGDQKKGSYPSLKTVAQIAHKHFLQGLPLKLQLTAAKE